MVGCGSEATHRWFIFSAWVNQKANLSILPADEIYMSLGLE